jgi:hypothetical protein
VHPTIVQLIGAVLFVCAILHTFATKYFERLAHARPAHAGLWHFLGEVEVVFGFWSLLLVIAILLVDGAAAATRYVDTRNFTEPMFVFAVMVIAGTRPILLAAQHLVHKLANLLPLARNLAFFFTTLALVPLLGSFITEPAAMTLAALILGRSFFLRGLSLRLKYATLGVLFVNVSIGGTLTAFAAPPVLMVATKWGWDGMFMLGQFGWKAALAVAANALLVTLLFRRELNGLPAAEGDKAPEPVPLALTLTHLAFLAAVVAAAHHPAIFMGLFLFFLGVAHAYKRHQNPLILREALLVAFFLAGLVVLGGVQEWWLKPLLLAMNSDAVYAGATVLTAVTDNAALTYLGSLVPGLSDAFKYALVAGAVTGGGLTVIANAPNPAGLAILREHFDQEAVNPLGLLAAALLPTLIAATALMLL